MTVPQVADEFLDLLASSGLLDREQFETVVWRYRLRDENSPTKIAQKLVHERILTKFQALRLLKGKRRGLVIDRYKLLYVLGSGGMGTVYAAEERETKWKVAVKVLSPKFRRDSGMFARFQLEGQAGLRLAHPNILRTLSVGRTEDVYGEIHFVAMEMVPGVTLPELLMLERVIPWQQACDIIYQTAVGLQYAHDAGLVHRDVKPENLLIRSDGGVKILDFGLAMLDENDEEFSMAMIAGQDRCLGTADYIAPEQSLDSYKVDGRADIYSLGCTFYAGLAGRVPFPVKTVAEKLQCHRRKKPVPLSKLRSDVPPQVVKIIEKMMAKQPELRFRSAAEVAKLLQPLARREKVDFDFNRILAARAAHVEKRMAAQSTQRRVVDTNGGKSTETPAKPSQANKETHLRDDTDLSSSKARSSPQPPAGILRPNPAGSDEPASDPSASDPSASDKSASDPSASDKSASDKSASENPSSGR